MSTTIPHAVSTMITENPKLNATNWFEWSKKMKMVFRAADLDGIASGSPPTEKVEKERWDRVDRQMIAYLYLAIEDDYRYLVEDEDTASEGWKKLKAEFERSTMGHRMSARKELYNVLHDPSLPITHYVQTLTSARKKLELLGCKIEDTEFKDLLLMNLDTSYHAIRTSLLVQSAEPTLDAVKTTLTTSAAVASIQIAAHGRVNKLPKVSLTDENGFRWCNPLNDSGCQRCGRPGHRAWQCTTYMPKAVKDQLLESIHFPNRPAVAKESAGVAYSDESDSDGPGSGGVGHSPLLI